jgi:hypothetical protein
VADDLGREPIAGVRELGRWYHAEPSSHLPAGRQPISPQVDGASEISIGGARGGLPDGTAVATGTSWKASSRPRLTTTPGGR